MCRSLLFDNIAELYTGYFGNFKKIYFTQHLWQVLLEVINFCRLTQVADKRKWLKAINWNLANSVSSEAFFLAIKNSI